MTITQKAKIIAKQCADAYSAERYSSWSAVAAMLLRRGYTPVQTETIMRSKITRWAGDMSDNRYGRYTAKDVERYLDKFPNDIRDLDQMVAATQDEHEMKYDFE